MTIKTPIFSFDEAVEWIEKSPVETRRKICFSYRGSSLSCDDLYNAIYRIKRIFPAFNPTKQLDIFVQAMPIFFDKKIIFNQSSQDPKSVSIIIPFRNRPEALKSCLESLAIQQFDKKTYEIILAADGADSLAQQYANEIRTKHSDLNIVYIQVSRTSNFFGAGLMRNIATEYALGEVLLFLDGDIVAPPELLKDVWESHLNYDVIQYPRKHIKPDGAEVSISSYWSQFYGTSKPWSKLPLFWKYTSTSCLSVKKSLFDQCGGFHEAFQSYGFEDTHLGYKLSYLTHRWKIGDIWTDHLLQASENPVAVQNPLKKKGSLHESAKTFFLLTKDTDFYCEFFALMGKNPNLRWAVSKMCFHLKVHWLFFSFFNIVQFFLKPWLLKKYFGQYIQRPYGLFLKAPVQSFWGSCLVKPFGLYIERPFGIYVRSPISRFIGFCLLKPFGIYVKSPISRFIGFFLLKPFGLYVSRPFGLYIKKPIGSFIFGNMWLLKHPVSWLKQKFPKIYFVLVRPIEKTYYFVEYQFKKRILRREDLTS